MYPDTVSMDMRSAHQDLSYTACRCKDSRVSGWYYEGGDLREWTWVENGRLIARTMRPTVGNSVYLTFNHRVPVRATFDSETAARAEARRAWMELAAA